MLWGHLAIFVVSSFGSAGNKLGLASIKKLAGAGDLFDMTIHRIDFAQDLLRDRSSRSVVPWLSSCLVTKPLMESLVRRRKLMTGRAFIGFFESGAVGVWEGRTPMKGHNNKGVGYEWAEVNSSEGSATYQLTDPNNIILSRNGKDMEGAGGAKRVPGGSGKSS